MGVLYDFNRLIKKYSTTYTLLAETSGGWYEGGEWVSESSFAEKEITGVLISITTRKVYQNGGTYTEANWEFITITEIPLEPTHYIVCKGAKYKVDANTDYSVHADFYAYNLKRIGAFEQ